MSFIVNNYNPIGMTNSTDTGDIYAFIDITCNDVSDLPAADAIVPPYIAAMGSKAHVVSNQLDYEMSEYGTWVQKQSQDLVSIVTDLSRLDGEVASLGDDITDLFSAVGDIRDAVKVLIDNGAKNIADMTRSSFTSTQKDGVTVTLSGDTITSTGNSGTTTNSFYNVYYTPNTIMIPSGIWCSSLHGNGIESFRLEVYDNITGDVTRGNFGEPFTFTIPDGVSSSYLRITQKPSSTCDGSFKLMICKPEYYAISHNYAMYAPTNRELYELIRGYHP